MLKLLKWLKRDLVRLLLKPLRLILKSRLLKLLVKMPEEEKESLDRIKDKENQERIKMKRKKLLQLLRKLLSKKPRRMMLQNVKEEEEEPVKANNECYFNLLHNIYQLQSIHRTTCIVSVLDAITIFNKRSFRSKKAIFSFWYNYISKCKD